MKMQQDDLQSYLVLSAIAKGASTLEEIARKAGGIYPLELIKLLEELIMKDQIKRSNSGYALAIDNAEESFVNPTPNRIVLPEPHPLDYDWRFNTTTSQYLADLISRENPYEKNVLLLGAPSALVEVIRSLPTNKSVTLIDNSQELVNYFNQLELGERVNIVAHNLMAGDLWEHESKFGIVITDPPWYTEHYIAFLAQASYVTSLGAMIVLSLLPLNTRPKAVEDRWQVLATAQQLGLHIQSLEVGKAEYETPKFEVNSLQAAKVNITSNWRAGDFAVFRKVQNLTKREITEIASSSYTLRLEDQDWAEMLIGTWKIKLRGPFDDYHVAPELISIEKDDILPTVSRRYPGRQAVDLWLWDNRVFGLKGRSSFWAALHTLAGRSIPGNLMKVSNMNHQYALTLLTEKLGLSNTASSLNQTDKLKRIEAELLSQNQPLTIKKLEGICKQLELSGHLAILTQPYLNKIITRHKTIESRFSKVRIPPYRAVHKGDVLFLKESSGSIIAIAAVSKAEFFGPLRPGEENSIMEKYSQELALEDSFKQIKKGSRYVTLLHLSDVLSIKPIAISKTDRRPWVILRDEPNRLF